VSNMNNTEHELRIYRHSIGDCEMLPRPNGQWMTVSNLCDLIDWLSENDGRDVMLVKIEHLKEAAA
jgi:hypothetical protein